MSVDMFTLTVISIIIHGVSAFVCGNIADKKGYSYEGYVILGLFLGLIGVVISIFVPDKTSESSSESDKAAALREYRKLLDDGTITQDEFDTKKQKLLS